MQQSWGTLNNFLNTVLHLFLILRKISKTRIVKKYTQGFRYIFNGILYYCISLTVTLFLHRKSERFNRPIFLFDTRITVGVVVVKKTKPYCYWMLFTSEQCMNSVIFSEEYLVLKCIFFFFWRYFSMGLFIKSEI